jgi:hypothetical protein
MRLARSRSHRRRMPRRTLRRRKLRSHGVPPSGAPVVSSRVGYSSSIANRQAVSIYLPISTSSWISLFRCMCFTSALLMQFTPVSKWLKLCAPWTLLPRASSTLSCLEMARRWHVRCTTGHAHERNVPSLGFYNPHQNGGSWLTVRPRLRLSPNMSR